MRAPTFLFLLWMIPSWIEAQCWVQIKPQVQPYILNDVFFLDSLRGWTVSSKGHVVKTVNGGDTWTEISTNTNNWLDAVHFVDSLNGWIAGSVGIMMRTTDGGNTWNFQTVPDPSQFLESVFFTSVNHGWAVGSGWNVLKTTNGGATWTSVDLGGLGNSKVFFFDALHGWILGTANGNSRLLRTVNGGQTWTAHPLPSGTFYVTTNFHFASPNKGWAVSDNSIYHTNNGGITWTEQLNFPVNFNPFTAIHFPDTLHGWAVAWGGQVYRTSNGGNTWVYESTPTDDILYDVHFCNANVGYTVGTFGEIMKYVSGPDAWINATALSACEQEYLTFTGHSKYPGAQFSWYLDDNPNPVSTGSTYTTPWNMPPGQYKLRVKSRLYWCDQSAFSDTIQFQILDKPFPDLGPTRYICAGQSVTLTANDGASYQWSTGQNEASITVTPTNQYNYFSVTVTSSDGCSAAETVSVVVNQTPSIDLGPDTTVCAGKPVKLVLPFSISQFYTWSTGQSGYQITVTPDTTTTYTVKATIPSTGCFVYDTITVFVKPKPIANAGPDQLVCPGDSVTLTATGGGAYAWSFGVQQGVPFIQTLSYRVYRVTVTNDVGCTSTDLVTVNIIPDSSIGNITMVNGYLSCADTIPMGCLTSFDQPSFLWSGPGNFTSTQQFPADISLPGIYQVVVTNTAVGCSRSGTGTFTVDLASPMISIQTLIPPEFGQSNGSIQVDLSNVVAGYQVTWLFGNNFFSEEEDLFNLQPGAYTCVVSNPNGCTNSLLIDLPSQSPTLQATPVYTAVPSGGAIVTLQISGNCNAWQLVAQPQATWLEFQPDNGIAPTVVTVTVDPNPETIERLATIQLEGCTTSSTLFFQQAPAGIAEIVGDPAICSGSSTTLTAQGGVNAQFQWSTGSNLPQIVVTEAGLYQVTISSGDEIAYGAIEVTTLNAPSTPTIEPVDANTLIAVATGATYYQWYFDGTPIPNASDPVFVANTSGAYQVQAFSADSCSSALSSIYPLTLVSQWQPETVLNNIQVIPNPVGNSCLILLSNPTQLSLLQLISPTGLCVWSKQPGAQHEIFLERANLPPGLYALSAFDLTGRPVSHLKLILSD